MKVSECQVKEKRQVFTSFLYLFKNIQTIEDQMKHRKAKLIILV